MIIPPVLTYHSVDESESWTSISPILFRQQMDYLSRNGYQCLSLLNWIEILISGKSPPRKSFVITFDDGYKNNYEVALPILKACQFTATIFVVTGALNKSSAWERLRGIPDLPILSREEVRELSMSGIDIQPHSHTHTALTTLDNKQIKEELLTSKKEIGEITGKEADIFCYPYGYYSSNIIDLLKEAGFKSAVTIDFGRDRSGADLFRLKRIGSAHFRTLLRFRLVMAGWYDLYITSRKVLRRSNLS